MTQKLLFQLKPREFMVRYVWHSGEGPVDQDGHHVIGVSSCREAAEQAAAAVYREANDDQDPCMSGDGVHVDVEAFDGTHERFFVACDFKITWTARKADA